MTHPSPKEKWAYAAGTIPSAAKEAAFINFVVFYYTQVLGLSGTLAGLAMLLALIWDAITDPLVGSWSDQLRTRWGRRHPLMLAGGVPTALLLYALFSPPRGLGELEAFAWLLGVSLLLRTAITINFIPYQALGAELSNDYDQRTVIAKARVTASWLAGIFLPATAYALVFQSGDGSDGRLLADNYAVYGVMSATLALVGCFYCVWGTRTAIPRLPAPEAAATRFGLARAWSDFRLALGNSSFRCYIGFALAFGVCAGTATTLALYMSTYFWEFTTIQLAWLAIPTLLGTLTAFLILGPLGRRYDKPQLIAGMCLAFFFNSIWFVGARLLDLLPGNEHPAIFTLQVVHTWISITVVVAMSALTASLLADILDEQELATGERQEGVFFAAATFIFKATSGLGSLAGGLVIDFAGLETGLAPGEVPTATLNTMGWWAGPITSLLVLVAWWFASRLELGRDKIAAIQQSLKPRLRESPESS